MVNVGSMDRTLRFIAGAALLAAPFAPPLAGFFAGWGQWWLAVPAVGLIMIGTAAFRFCPAYTLLGVRTCEVEKR